MDSKGSMESPKIKVQTLEKIFLDFRLGFWDIDVYTKRSPSSDIWEGPWNWTKGLLKGPRHCKLTWHGKILPRSKENHRSLTFGNEHHMLDSASITEKVTEPERPVYMTSRAMLCHWGATLPLTRISLWERSLCHKAPLKPGEVCLCWGGVHFNFEIPEPLLKKEGCAESDSTFSWDRFLVKSLRMSKYPSVFLKDGN